MRRIIIVSVVTSVIAASCGSGDTDEATDTNVPPPTTQPVTTTAVPTEPATTAAPFLLPAEQPPPIPAGTASLTVTYDGTGCVYEGPAELPESALAVTLINTTDQDVGLGIRRLFDGVTMEAYEAEAAATGGPPNTMSHSLIWLNRDLRGLQFRGAATENAYANAGLHDLFCVVFEGNGPPTIHNAAVLSVVSATAAPDRPALTVTYDGSGCTYKGPERFSAGPVDVTLINDSDGDVGLELRRLFHEVVFKTFSERLSVHEPPPNYLSHSVLWLSRDLRGLEWKGELTETVFASAGSHGLLCVVRNGDGPPIALHDMGEILFTATG